MKIITDKPSYVINEARSITRENWDHPENLAVGQLSMERLFRTVSLNAPHLKSPLPMSLDQLDIEHFHMPDPLRPNKQITGEQFLNRRLFNDGLLVMHKGAIIHESYRNGLTADDRHVLHSCTKSLCAMLVAMAIEDGLLVPSEQISHYIPEFRKQTAWQDVTLQHVLDMQAGLTYSEDYTDPDADYWSYARAAGYYPPRAQETAIGVKAWIFAHLNKRSDAPGEAFSYNSCLANILGMALEQAYHKPLAELFEQQLYAHTGATEDGYFNTDPQGFPIVEGQLSLRLRDFARCAYPIINGGKSLSGHSLISPKFIEQISTPDPRAQSVYHARDKDNVFPDGQYRNQFWGVNPGQKQFAMLGIHGQFAWFDLNKDLMIVGFGSYPKQDGPLMMTCLKWLWQAIGDKVAE